MELILYTADCTGIPSNCVYPHEVVVDSKEKMAEAIEKDHVCAKYKNNYRSNENFMEANGFFMDNDNDHTDNPAEFITAEKLSEMLADVDHVIVPSRHNMLPKGSKPAKPRQHIYFPCQPYKDSTMYAAVKRAIQKKFPFLDDNAVDAARFFFGSSCDADDIIWNEGFLQIDETLDEDDYIEEAVEKEEYQTGGGVIHEGSRNNTLSLFAGKVLKKFGITDKAHDLFLERAAKCDPPLDDRELKTIWNSAVGFAKKIQSQEGYVPPEEFNAEFDAGLKPEDYSDIGEAKVLAKEYGSELKYTTATDYLRFDGECWREDRQMALGAAEDFLDLQLADAREQVEIAEQALLGAGVSEENVKSGGKQLEKAVPDNSMGLLFALMGAQTYLKFVLRYRNYKNIVNFQNAAKPMLAIDVSELDKDPNLLNTPYMSFGTGSKEERISGLKKEIEAADAIVIGAGAGLSTSAGLTYSGERFQRYFFDFARKYGIRDMYSGGFYPFPDEETRWAWWARHIYFNRYIDAPKPVYQELLSLVKDKDFFVVTTNVDHQFQRAGFDKKRLFYTQGDYGLFQSVNPFMQKTYDNEEWVMKAMEAQGFVKNELGVFQVPEDRNLRMRIPTALIPKCPDDGSDVTMNLRADDSFVEDGGWHRASAAYADFLRRHESLHVLYLELGVGANTPVIVKYPFWQMTLANEKSVYACINYGEAFCPGEIANRSICIDGNIGDVFAKMK